MVDIFGDGSGGFLQAYIIFFFFCADAVFKRVGRETGCMMNTHTSCARLGNLMDWASNPPRIAVLNQGL